MTLEQVIEKVLEYRPTDINKKEIAKIICSLDGRAKVDATGQAGEVTVYPDNAESMLFIPFPYDDAYVWYALAEISAMSNDPQVYQNDATIFNEKYQSWLRSYKSTHCKPSGGWRGMHIW